MCASNPPTDLGGPIDFTIMGENHMNWSLRAMFECGTTECDVGYDPTGDEHHYKPIHVEDSCYYVTAYETNPSAIAQIPILFQYMTPVFILTYDICSQESLQELEIAYNQIPAPENGIVRIPPLRTTPELFVLMDQYPKVIIGCKISRDNPRVVEKEDVDKFILNHPECIFGGEWTPVEEVNSNVENIFRTVVEVYHELRKRGKREGRLFDPEPTITPEIRKAKRRRSKACTIL